MGSDIVEDFMTVKEAAKRWNISERRVAVLCKSDSLKGAKKVGRYWMIPKDMDKPKDRRIKSGKFQKHAVKELLPLPVGVSDYRLASSVYYYVDKTFMIKELIDERALVTLFTRPRRFGKTLNMDMLRTFFEKTDEDTSIYFHDKIIWSCGKKYREYQGKFPMIFISFKDIKFLTWEETFLAIKDLFAKEAYRHLELKTSHLCDDYDHKCLEKLLCAESNEVDLSMAIANLSRMLHKHYGIAPIVIVDEYDIPIQQGYLQGYYDQVILFMRNLFSAGFKDNRHLSYGFLTGILRVAKESIFSGLNNLVIHSVLDHKYSSYFGFTTEEVQQMASYYGVEDKFEELCDWYDGYRFGKTDIFNPWSVINYFSSSCEPRAYWSSTGSNEIIMEILAQADMEIYSKLTSLLDGKSVVAYIDTGVIYPQIKQNPSSIYSFLLVAGYLKSIKTTVAFHGDSLCEIALPNREIRAIYQKEILQHLEYMIPQSSVISIQEALYRGDSKKLQTCIQQLLLHSISYYDGNHESFYHGLMLGICVLLSDYYVTSNRESGFGRYDISLMPKKQHLPGIIMELKSGKYKSNAQIKELAQEALCQIEEKAYDQEMKSHGWKVIHKYGVAFCGKHVEVLTSIDENSTSMSE